MQNILRRYSFLYISFLVLATFSIQHTSAAVTCWDCDKLVAREAVDEQSPIEKNPNRDSLSANNVSPNALDSVFQDPPQDALLPQKKDNISGPDRNDSRSNNQQDASLNNIVSDPSTELPPDRWSGIDTLVAIFFAVAAIWLIAATIYSIALLVLIRLQARGELDIYDEDLGRWTLCNGRFSLHFGCILRRYAVQLERDYQRRLQQRYGNSNGDLDAPQDSLPIRIMTREERRLAVEQLLGLQSLGKLQHVCMNEGFTMTENLEEKTKSPCGPVSPTHSLGSSQDGPVCSICLDGYGASDLVFKSTSCAHMFHKDCLMEWLERRNNTDCPCCRNPLVSDEDVWKTVKRLRREKRRLLMKENGCTHRIIQWILAKRRRRNLANVETGNRELSMGSTSSEGDDPESQSGSHSEIAILGPNESSEEGDGQYSTQEGTNEQPKLGTNDSP
ncbi:ring finger domain containing protein [Nitzschia inconspicua]|uniref:Ring finger domain containing protein n=1 Tax=Nitzschia inconspicua TaxID=303405 RepID=A0A9K3PXH8_9STRA|nr:ring finger domain containing protein [Nitzschia inconspicua]